MRLNATMIFDGVADHPPRNDLTRRLLTFAAAYYSSIFSHRKCQNAEADQPS